MTTPPPPGSANRIPPPERSEPGSGWLHARAIAGRVRPWRWQIATGIAIFVLVTNFGPGLLLGPRVGTQAATRHDIVQSVVAVGHVESRHRVDIGAQVTGVVASIPVEEGQAVKEGDVLILLDERDVQAAVDQARGARASAEARFRQIEESTLPTAQQALQQAEATLLNAQQNFARTEKLQAQHFATTSQLDTDRRDLDVAATRVRAARLVLTINQPGGTEHQFARNEVSRAAATLRSAEARLSYARILAPVDGTLIFRDVERGDIVQPSRVVMRLAPTGEVQLVVQIDERNLSLIAPGKAALAAADAYPGHIFPAQIVFINPSVNLQRGAVEVKLRVAPTDLPPWLREDMTVSVDIEVARKQGALVLAPRFVHDIDGPAPWVLKVDGGHARRQPVKLGLRGGIRVEIGEGLAEGERAIAPDAAVGDGDRIRAMSHE